MLVVIGGLENWRYLLEGAKFEFEIQTNHKNLECLKHVLGTKIRKTDKLSGRLDWKVGIEDNNNNQVFIKNYQICNLSEVVIEGSEVDILEKIKIARSKDEKIVRVVEKMKNAGVKEIRGEKWQIEGKLVLKEGKVYVLKK